MTIAQSYLRWARNALLALFFFTCLALPSVGHAAAASAADRALVSSVRALEACQAKHPGHCDATRRAVRRAGRRLGIGERRLAKLAHSSDFRALASAAKQAPQLTVSGRTLHWTRPGGEDTFIVMRKVPGQGAQYSLIEGTSTTPPPVSGDTVSYSVRTTARGSEWAPEQSIAYPAATQPSTPPTSTPPRVETPLSTPSLDPQTPPTHGPPANAPEPPAPPASTPPEAPASGSNFQPGLISGTNMKEDLQGAALLGAKVVRVGWSIGTTAAEMEPVIAGYASKGIRVQPLAEFYETLPTPAEARNLANWAKAYGPGGTFWAGRSDGALAIGAIEFGNETASEGQYGDVPGEPSFFARAQTYAIRFREAAEAIAATDTSVGLLAQDEDVTGDWMSGMYSAVPNLSKYVAGWTIHPYGGEQYNRERLDALISQTAEHGASAIPIDITEWGVSTDNGSCVNFNEGFNLCMTYEEAAQTLKSTVAWISTLLGGRLGDFFLYQVRDQQPAGKTSNCQDYYGVLQHELQPKGAYTTAAQALLGS